MARLQDQNSKHQDVIIGWAAALDPVAPWNRLLQIGPKQFKIDNRVQPLKIIALGGEILQTLVDIEKPSLPTIPKLPIWRNRSCQLDQPRRRFLRAQRALCGSSRHDSGLGMNPWSRAGNSREGWTSSHNDNTLTLVVRCARARVETGIISIRVRLGGGSLVASAD
jgi:hypothetical protein